jgi:hypothetical protein
MKHSGQAAVLQTVYIKIADLEFILTYLDLFRLGHSDHLKSQKTALLIY